jgi:hypothetical protein
MIGREPTIRAVAVPIGRPAGDTTRDHDHDHDDDRDPRPATTTTTPTAGADRTAWP